MARIEAAAYARKFEALVGGTEFRNLSRSERSFLRELSLEYRLTFQELREVALAARDLSLWREEGLESWWRREKRGSGGPGRTPKSAFLSALRQRMASLRSGPVSYPEEGLPQPKSGSPKIVARSSDRKIFGRCPVYSESTLCCGLYTLDAVERCSMGCSYCTIQTFYGESVVFDEGLREKLESLELPDDRFLHVGTGQSSDSLLWGNRNGLLDHLCDFARRRPNVLLELKTKSKNVRYFLEREVPANVVCSWSLNSEAVIRNEEHRTAPLEERLSAAQRVVERGVKVAFHLHPMVHYEGWEEGYADVVRRLLERFSPRDVLFVSFGTLTFIKPVLKELRRRGVATKVTQMPMEKDPHGKLTYPAEVKEKLYRHVYRAFAPWHGKVFMYLCMERPQFWETTFGFCYRDSGHFEEAFAESVQPKLLSA